MTVSFTSPASRTRPAAGARGGQRRSGARSPALPSPEGDGSEGCLRSGINDRANNDREDEEVESAAALNAPAALLAVPSCDSMGVRSAEEGAGGVARGFAAGLRFCPPPNAMLLLRELSGYR